MKAVILSDIYCSKILIAFYTVFVLISAGFACFGGPPFVTFYPFVIFNFAIFSRAQNSENCGWERYLDASGVARRAQVSARFVESAVINLSTAAVFAAAMAINALFVKEEVTLSAAEIFMFVALDFFIGAALSLLIAIYYIIADQKTRGWVYFLAIIAIVFLPMQLMPKVAHAAHIPLTDIGAKSAVLCGSALLAASAATYAALYAASAARFEKKEG